MYGSEFAEGARAPERAAHLGVEMTHPDFDKEETLELTLTWWRWQRWRPGVDKA
jgi:hypothetical protein